MQWSTARTPVLSQMESGVVWASSGSRITSSGPRIGGRKLYLRFELSSVPPAKLEYSPAERDVGTEMIGTVGVLISFRLFGPSARVPSSSGVRISFARAWG